MNHKEKQTGENIITPQKIWQNLKRYWWFCVIPLIVCAAFVYSDTMSDYHKNLAAAQKDTYIASALVYFPTEDEEIGKGNMVIFKSQNTLERVNAVLEENGYGIFDENRDSMDIGHTMASYGITLIGEGKERMLCMGQAFAESMLEVIKEATGTSGYIVDAATVAPCMIDAAGNTIIYKELSQKQVSLSLRNFLTWKKMMILCAGVFLGLALIFVAILFDRRIRSTEDMEAFDGILCMGVIGEKREAEKKMFCSLTAAMCNDRQVTSLVLAAVAEEPLLASLSEQAQAACKGVQVTAARHLSSSPDTIARCRESGAVVLAVKRNRDDVFAVQKALNNLDMIQAQVLGYVLTE